MYTTRILYAHMRELRLASNQALHVTSMYLIDDTCVREILLWWYMCRMTITDCLF